MNKKIRDIAKKCIEDSYESRVGIEDFERFAELIVMECAMYVKNTNCFTSANQADLCAQRMKEHFKVKP